MYVSGGLFCFAPPPPLFFLLATVCQLASSSYLISSLLKDVCQIIPGTALPLNIIATFITLQVPINFQNMWKSLDPSKSELIFQVNFFKTLYQML